MLFIKPGVGTKIAVDATISNEDLRDFQKRYNQHGISIEVDPWEEVVEVNTLDCTDETVIKEAELYFEDLVVPIRQHFEGAALLAAANHF